jgi:hypothetical protein
MPCQNDTVPLLELFRSPSFFHRSERNWPSLVGAARFELATPCAQGRCATRLRYAPIFFLYHEGKMSDKDNLEMRNSKLGMRSTGPQIAKKLFLNQWYFLASES